MSTREFLVMAKPAGPRCNLACGYCYYLPKLGLLPTGAPPRMPDAVLARYVAEYLAASPGPVTHFEWHGGEPTLAGLQWFRRAVALQRELRPPGRTITNGLQTNGTLLDDAWAGFLAEEGFSVGLSLDGPEAVHDRFRVGAAGQPTHRQVVEAWRLLRRHGVAVNVLCVVHAGNVAEPLAVYHFLRDLGASHVQFLPLVEPASGGGVTARTAAPEAIGEFLCRIFDTWARHDLGRVVVQAFDEALRHACGLPHALCVFRETCGDVLVVEQDGGVYACDHFVDAAHRLGTLCEGGPALGELVEAPALRAFGAAKRDALPPECRRCDVLGWCNGGCPKDRVGQGPGGAPAPSFLCPAYRRFFRHAAPVMRRLADAWRREQAATAPARPAARGVPPNAPCPCGSGRKFKRCCRH